MCGDNSATRCLGAICLRPGERWSAIHVLTNGILQIFSRAVYDLGYASTGAVDDVLGWMTRVGVGGRRAGCINATRIAGRSSVQLCIVRLSIARFFPHFGASLPRSGMLSWCWSVCCFDPELSRWSFLLLPRLVVVTACLSVPGRMQTPLNCATPLRNSLSFTWTQLDVDWSCDFLAAGNVLHMPCYPLLPEPKVTT